MMRYPNQQSPVSAQAMSEEEELRGISIDGYEVEFTTKVALMPVDLVALTRGDGGQQKGERK